MTIISVYKSSIGSPKALADHLRRLCNERSKPRLVIGDFNICNKKQFRNSVKIGMKDQGFICLTSEATQIRGGYIDHAYWRDDDRLFNKPELERHSPYYSDHDALCVTIRKKVSIDIIVFN